ncbi:hypothetical protein [Sphingobacterium sp. UBA5670]|uniref:hypothetical protein n=1 Tax=Sphingobacterium sp. UBA5670 TaxID=1947502 RepID=UPI0025EB7F30|nr:hypothetical protein [Sphingobacterium sp. UBA5670]
MSLNELTFYLAVATLGISLLFLHRYIAVRRALRTDIEIYLWENDYTLLRYDYKLRGRKDVLKYKPYLEHGYKSGRIFLDLHVKDSKGYNKVIEAKISIDFINIQSVEFRQV